MAFGIPKIDVPAITKDLNEKFKGITDRLDTIIVELKKLTAVIPVPVEATKKKKGVIE